MKAAGRCGQVMVSFAFLLSLALLPVVAFAVEAAVLASHQSRLQAAVSAAAEGGAQQVDTAALRATGSLGLDQVAAAATARDALAAADPAAVVDRLTTSASGVAVAAHEEVPLQLAFLGGARSVAVRASAAARIRPGYAAPQ